VNVDGQEHSEVIKLLKHIFPTLMNLGCDSDVLVRQLFEPLVLQIVHFQTSRQKIGSQETDVLIDSIMVCSM
jgi:DNA-dependent protein kinase catalytic subunit